ncbi:MAG TPA: hypothetical protein VGC91_15105 [Pyrinomonadaceae bacterium]|jgi:hypothetical protein
MAYEEKLISYLSKEIETQTNNLMTFRERINFAVFIGPFVLLGTTLYGKGIPHINWGGLSVGVIICLALSFLGILLSYLTMGIACSLIEVHIWRQCNLWRHLIAEISQGTTIGVRPDQLEFQERLKRGYLWVYSAMIVAFGCAILLVLILQAHT